jgi:hypothetical protein
MGKGFCPITYPLVEKFIHTASLAGKTHRVLGFQVPIAIFIYDCTELIGQFIQTKK